MHAVTALPIIRCDLSDLPVEGCGCRIHRPGPNILDIELHHTRVVRDFGRPVDANYPGTCPGCQEPYDVGDPIRFDNKGAASRAAGPATRGRWWHDNCAQEA